MENQLEAGDKYQVVGSVVQPGNLQVYSNGSCTSRNTLDILFYGMQQFFMRTYKWDGCINSGRLASDTI